MGLGGIARDSIVGLDRIGQDDKDDDRPHVVCRRFSDEGILSTAWAKSSNIIIIGDGSKGGTSNSNKIMRQDDDHADKDPFPLMHLSRVASFHVPLADSVAGSEGPPTIIANSSLTVAAKSSERSSSGGKDSTAAASTPTLNKLSHYQGFQYDEYADYYLDDFSSYSYDEYSYSSASARENKNIFCCLFAPWLKQKIVEDKEEDIPDTKNAHSDIITSEDSTSPSLDEIVDSWCISPTPSNEQKYDLGCESASSSESLELLNLHPNAMTPKTTKNSVSVDLVEKEIAPPYQMSLDDESSPPPLSISAPPSLFQSEEKKEDEEDNNNDDDQVKRVTSSSDANRLSAEDGQKDNIPTATLPIKGILKAWCSTNSLTKTKDVTTSKSITMPVSPNKRQLFPTYEQKKSNSPKHTAEAKSITFKPTARVLTIPSRNDIPLQQKAQIWWQKYDYDEFKKTGRIISKAMECGGSEIWLASSNAWGDKSARSSGREQDAVDSSIKHSEEYTRALSKYAGNTVKEDFDSSESGGSNNYGNKWWCKFGHSRRGLEHVASSSEGKARQQSVLLAIQMVMEEQKRQRSSRMKDPNKLRSVSMQYTSWAKDLALAAAAADAEAVSSNFDPSALCRAQHFAKRLNVNSSTWHTLNNSDIVGGGVAMAITSQILDANTHRTSIVKSSPDSHVQKSLQDANSRELHRAKDISLSKRAKGFMPGGADDVSAASLLSGMGNMGFRSVKA